MRIIPDIAIVLLALAVAAFLTLWSSPARPPARGGISRLERVDLGGTRQWISMRAADPRAPVLLFLHGGPGSASIAKLRLQAPELEKHFVVVNWDQPGAGKSSKIGFDYTTLSIDRIVSDAHELVGLLKARFCVNKVYLMGFSWGTALGLELVRRYPEDFIAYIGVSQMVWTAEGERLSLEYSRQVARRKGNQRAIAELDRIDPTYQSDDWYRQTNTARKWLLRYGGIYHTANSFSHEIKLMLQTHEYSLLELALWPAHESASLKQVWREAMSLNFMESVQEVEVPVHFFAGKYDYNVPSALIEPYFQQLADPAGKHLVWFEHSAHDIFFDEPDRLVAETLAVLQSSM